VSAKAKARTEPPRRLGDCAPGDIVQTPCGWLYVTGLVKNGALVQLWHVYEKRTVSQTFGVSSEIAVLDVTRKETAMPPAAGGEFDPVRGGLR